jgi:hypothetical protein
MPNQTQPLSNIVDVAVTVSPTSPATPTFNAGLIVGNSGVIPTIGANSRVRQYSSLSAMLTDGFTANSPEYIAAQLYFSQSPAPTVLYVGAQDPSALATIAVDATEGTAYVVGDILTIVQAGASGGTVKVTAIGANGAATAVQLLTQGTGYSVATALVTTGGTGAGALIDVSAIGETPLQAVTACRIASAAWYCVMVCGAVKADHVAIGSYVQAAAPQCVYLYSTSDADALAGASTSVFGELQTLSINRAFGLYSTTQGGGYPSNAYAAAAVMGYAMGANTGLANSQFTLKFKSLVNVAIEPLSQSQIAAIEAVSGNVYVSYANVYSFLEQGVMANGDFFDNVLGIDTLASAIQYGVMDELTSAPSIPQTDAGETLLINRADQACSAAVTRGFLAPGTWEGQTVLNLTAGTPMPKGYVIQAQSFTNISKADKAARKGMPIYVSIAEAGAIHSITIGVYVQL